MKAHSIASRVVGFTASLVLTLTAFFLFAYPTSLDLPKSTMIAIVLALAALQFAVQSIFFLNVLNEKGPRWNLVVYASTLSIIFIIVLGAIWIMHHLNYNMMPGH